MLPKQLKKLAAGTHVGPREFVGGAIVIPEFKLTLPESKMDEWVANRSWTTHCVGEIVATCNVISSGNVGIPNRNQNPSGGFPLGFWLGKQIPGSPIIEQSISKPMLLGAIVSDCAKSFYLVVDRIRELGHAVKDAFSFIVGYRLASIGFQEKKQRYSLRAPGFAGK